MTLEAIDADTGIIVAAATEVLIITETNLGVFRYMTVDAFFEAVLLGAYTFVHRFITLMKQVLHVIFSYIINRFYAFR